MNVLIFVYELTMPGAELRRLFYLFGIVPARYTHVEWAANVGIPVDDYWPFLTTQFLHGGWLHVITNMWILWIFGDNVEDRMGPVRFSAFYLLCGTASGLVHLLTNHASTVPTVGASGAISGVMGAYIAMFPNARITTLVPVFIFPFFFELPAFFYLGYWFLLQFFSGTIALAGPEYVSGVAWWAHVGGFLFGLITFRLFKRVGSGDDGTHHEADRDNDWSRL